MGIEPWTSAIWIWCSTLWAMEAGVPWDILKWSFIPAPFQFWTYIDHLAKTNRVWLYVDCSKACEANIAIISLNFPNLAAFGDLQNVFQNIQQLIKYTLLSIQNLQRFHRVVYLFLWFFFILLLFHLIKWTSWIAFKFKLQRIVFCPKKSRVIGWIRLNFQILNRTNKITYKFNFQWLNLFLLCKTN